MDEPVVPPPEDGRLMELMQLRAENEMLHRVVRDRDNAVAAWEVRFDKLLLLAGRLQ